MSRHKLRIELFGTFRKYGPEGFIEIEVPLPLSLKTIKGFTAEALQAADPGFDPEGVFKVSAFATEETVLRTDAIIDRPVRLAVIPPVSGG